MDRIVAVVRMPDKYCVCASYEAVFRCERRPGIE